MNIAIAGVMIWAVGCMLPAEDGLMTSEAELAQQPFDITAGMEGLVQEEGDALEVSGDAWATGEETSAVLPSHLWECKVEYQACLPTGVCRMHTYVGTDANIAVALNNAVQTCESAHFAPCTPLGCNTTH